MEKSQSITELAKALHKFQKGAPKVSKDGKANYGSYATLENLIDTVRSPLAEHGLSFSQLPSGDSLTTILMHESGEYIAATATLRLEKLTAQGQGSAITYMRRYALAAILGIASDDDDDGNVASNPTARTQARRTTKAETKGNPVDVAKAFIKKATTVDSLMTIDDRVKASKEFTEEQKTELFRLIQQRTELINVTKDNEPQ